MSPGTNVPALAHLFSGYRWNYLPDAILDGYMGEAFADKAARKGFPLRAPSCQCADWLKGGGQAT